MNGWAKIRGLFALALGIVFISIFSSVSLHAAGTPTITGLSPSTGSVNGGDSITISGTNFDSTATVKFGANVATSSNWIDASTIVAVSPAGYAGPADVSVTNKDGQVATSVNGFTYTEMAPTISTVIPNAGPANGGQSVTINGSNFTNGQKTITSISADTNQTGGSICGIFNANKVYCWGYNGFGQLGNNSTTQSSTAVPLFDTGALAGKTVKTLASGISHRCAIASDGKAYCWGRATSGALGNNSTTQSNVPVAVDTSGVLAGKTLTQIAAGDLFTCALSSDGLVFCWGQGSFGQLGNASTAGSLVPVAVDVSGVLAGKTVRQITAGASHACVVTTENLAYCWGQNGDGRLGNNATATSVSSPVAVYMGGVLAGKTVQSITAGSVHTCAIASDNQGYCWGTNTNGQLGTGNTTATKAPTAVVNNGALSGKTLRSISTSTDHTCAVASDDQAYCWGANGQGQIGDNGPITTHTSPTAVDTSGVLAGKTVRTVTTGYQKGCVIASDSLPYCWGNNNSSGLGDGTGNTRKVPVLSMVIKSSNPTVTFGGTSATGITLASSSQLQVTTPAHALGAVNVAVQNYDGQSATDTNAYQFVSGPTLSSISPSRGPIAGGTAVTIKGSNFYTGMTATIGGLALSNLVVVDSQTITATTPSTTTPGAQNVVVSDPYSQTATLTGGFTYRLPDQTIFSVTPNAGSYAGGYTVTIKGSNFIDKGAGQTWYRVLFGSSTSSNVTYVDSSTLTATVPSRGLGKVNVTIQSDYSNDATLANGFTYLAANYQFSNATLNIAATQPGKLTIQAVNASGSPVASSTDTVIQLSSSSTKGVFATDLNEDESTRWTHTSVVLPAFSTSVDVWYKDDNSGSPTITGTVSGVPQFQQQEQITSKYRLSVSGVSDPVSSGVPSSITVRVVDYNGVAQNDYTGTFSFSSTDGTAQLPSQYTMSLADHGIKTFTNGVVMKTPGEFCVSATDISDPSITGSQCNISVRAANSGSIDHLSIITQPQSIPVSTSSAPITVQAQDSANNPIPVSVDTPLYIYSTSSTASFSTDGSGWSGTKPYTVTIPSGSTSVNLFVKDSASTTSTLSARDLSTDTADNGAAGDSGWKNASQQLITGVSKANHVVLSGPDSLLINEKGTYTLTLKDSSNNTVTALQDNQLTLTSSTSTALFYINGDTTGVAGPVTILLPLGSTSLTFEMSDSTASVGPTMTHIAANDTRANNDADYLTGATDDVQILSAPADSVTLTPSQNNVEAGSTTPVTLQLLDTNGNPTYASSTKSFSLSTTSGSGAFSLTSSPFTPITSVNLLRGEGTKQLFYRDTIAGTSRIQANNSNLSSTSTPLTVTASGNYRLGVSPPSSLTAINTASSPFTTTAYDVYGNVVTQPSDLQTYAYSDDAAVAFAGQSNGPWTATSFTISAGQSTTQFYAKSASFLNQPATLTISDSNPIDSPDTGIANATSQFNVVGQPVANIAFSNSPMSVIAGQASGAITIELEQSDGSPAIQDGSTSVTVSVPEGKLTLTADPNANAVGSIPVSKGSSSVTFYYSGEKAGTYSIHANFGQSTDNQAVTVTADQPSRLSFISPPQTIAASQASSQIKVGVVDQFDNPTSFGSTKTVSLSSSCGDGAFSETTSPWIPTASLSLPAGATDFTFFYKNVSDGTCTITSSIGGITPDSQAITITPTGPTKLTINGSSTLEKGQTGSYMVTATDSAGNALPVNTSFDVSLSTSSSSGAFSTNTLHFTTGDTTQSFTYKDTTSQTLTLTAHDVSNVLSDGTLDVTVNDGVATQLKISPNGSTQRAGDKSLFTVGLLNQYDQPVSSNGATTVTLSSSDTTGKFYDSTNNTQIVTSVIIPNGQPSGLVYYSQSKSVQSTLKASASGLSDANASVTIIPASIASIQFTNSAYQNAQALEVGQQGTYQVALIDTYGNKVTTSSPVTLYATSTGGGALSNGGVFTVPANASTGSFTYMQTTSGTFNVSVSDSQSGNSPLLGPITQAGEVVPGAPAGIRFTQSGLTLERGAVSDKVSVQLVNSSGYPVPAPTGGQVINLSMAAGTGLFSTTPNGTFASSLPLTIPDGETEAGVYYRNDDAQIEDRVCNTDINGVRTCSTSRTYSHIIVGQTTLSSTQVTDSLPVTMEYGAPVRLSFTTPPRQQQANRATSIITVERQNQYGKAVPLHQDSLVNVATSSSTGTFGSSKTTWDVSQLKILDSDASTSFYYKDSQVGAPLLTVSSASGNLISDSQTVTITQASGPPPPAASLIVTNISDPQQQGTPSSVIVIAVDSDGFVVDSYAGTVQFTSDDTSATLPHTYTFDPTVDKGSKTFTNQVAFSLPGEKTVTATDLQGLTGSQTNITVLGGNTNPVSSIVFASPSSPVSLQPNQVSPVMMIQLLDSNGNPTTAPTGGMPIHLTSGQASGVFSGTAQLDWNLPYDLTIPEGISFANVYYKDVKAGEYDVTAADWVNGADSPSISNGSLHIINGSNQPSTPTGPTNPSPPSTPSPPSPDEPVTPLEPETSSPSESSPSDTSHSKPPVTLPPKNTVNAPNTTAPEENIFTRFFKSAPPQVLTGSIIAWFMVIVLLIEVVRHIIAVHHFRKIVNAYELAPSTVRSITFLRKVTRSAFLSIYFWLPALGAAVLAYVTIGLFSLAPQDQPSVSSVIIDAFLITNLIIGFVVIHTVYIRRREGELKAFFSHINRL